MRTSQQQEQIKSTFSPPFAAQDILSPSDIKTLIEQFHSDSDKIHKNTGPITVNFKNSTWSSPIILSTLDKIRAIIGDFEIISGFFFYVETPHIIHNDDSFELPDTYKGITLPLEIGHPTEIPSLCFFDQYYLHGPAKFFNGGPEQRMFYNTPVYQYDQVSGTIAEPFDLAVRSRYMTHLRESWLQGLSFDCALPWIPGNALIFDAVRLHCASDFRRQGIKSKLGISIFTKK